MTDDGELALALAHSLDTEGRFDEEAVARAYAAWYLSIPFDMGRTTNMALGHLRAMRGKPGMATLPWRVVRGRILIARPTAR